MHPHVCIRLGQRLRLFSEVLADGRGDDRLLACGLLRRREALDGAHAEARRAGDASECARPATVGTRQGASCQPIAREEAPRQAVARLGRVDQGGAHSSVNSRITLPRLTALLPAKRRTTPSAMRLFVTRPVLPSL